MCLAKSHWMGQQQQQRAMLTGVVYANAAAQLMKMIYVSSAHQANNTANIESASSLYHDYVSLHFYQVTLLLHNNDTLFEIYYYIWLQIHYYALLNHFYNIIVSIYILITSYSYPYFVIIMS